MNRFLSRVWHSPTLTTWGSMAVRLAGILVILPIVLRRFDTAEVAVWQLFASLFTLVMIFDLGLSPTFSRLLAFARGGAQLAEMADMRQALKTTSQGETSQSAEATAARIFATLRWLYPRLALLVVAAFGLAGSFALLKPISQCADPLRVWLAWLIVLAGSGAGFLGNASGAALQGMDSIAALRRWEVATGLAQVCCAIIAVAFGGDLLVLVAVYQFWTVCNTLRNVSLLKKLHPALLGPRPCADPEVLKILWPATWRSGLGVLFSQGIIQASGLVYSQLAVAADVASYLLALRFITTISQFSQAPFYSKLPRLGALQATGNRAEQLHIAQQGMRRAQWVLVVGALGVAYAVPWLLTAAHSKTDFVTPVIWAVLCCAFFVERFGAMHLQLYSLTNHIIWHIANGVTGTVMIVLALVLFPQLGLLALPLAMLLAYTSCYAALAVYKSSRAFDFSIFKFERTASLPAGLAMTLGLLPLMWTH